MMMTNDEVHDNMTQLLNEAITQALEEGGDPLTIREILEALAQDVCGD